jgi:hypothetical protein
MNESLSAVWWITAVEMPALAGLFWLITRVRDDADKAVDELRSRADNAAAQVRESLAAYKLEVAKSYAGVGHLKEVEKRLSDHLLRIEHKLEIAGPPACGGAEGGRR